MKVQAKSILLFIVASLITTGLSIPAHGAEYSFGARRTVIGCVKTYRVKPGESLIEIARKFDLGYAEIIAANPHTDPFVPEENEKVTIPSAWIVPDAGSSGIIINLSEFRLYYLPEGKGSRSVLTFPIGIGSQGHNTPLGEYSVIEKIVHPAWHVPASIRKEKPELPAVVPAGPNNPLGSHALRLSLGDVLIHGTNRPWAVGRDDSHGCIRLYPEDIPVLFRLVSRGAKVTIVRQPVKVGVVGNRVFVEVHSDAATDRAWLLNEAVAQLRKKGLLGRVSTEKLSRAVESEGGFPSDVTEG